MKFAALFALALAFTPAALADPAKTKIASGVIVGEKADGMEFHEVVQEYLQRISFGDQWATELVVPVTKRPLLRVRPGVASGEPLFIHGGAPLDAVRSRFLAGESVASLADDYGIPADEIGEALQAVWPGAAAA